MVADTVDESSNHPSLVEDTESDVYLTEHLAGHISATRHHLTGTPEHPEPPYAPSFHPPTGYWTPTEKALFFRALSVHSRLRPDLIAASIGTKSTVDVAIYISLLRQGATQVSNNKSTSKHDATITIGRDQHPVAHQVSEELVTLEDQQAAHVCMAEPMRAKEVESEARAETLRSMKSGMRVRRGEGKKGGERDRDGQLARKKEFERLRAEREIEWAREDALARLDAVALQVFDRMLRVDEERRVKVDSDDEEEEGKSSEIPHPVASSSSPAGDPHARTPPPTSLPANSTGSDNDNEDDTGAVPSNLSPASRRLVSKRLYMRRKRAEASGSTAQLDPVRLKPGRKASATSKYRPPRPHRDSDCAADGEDPVMKQPERGYTRPYKIQHDFERFKIGAKYLHENGLGMFHLGALGRLMRLYPRLDSSQPENIAESIAQETIRTLHTLFVEFTRGLVRRAITLRELDFALRAHTKLWRLGERVVRPLHVHRALELCGGARLSVSMHFEKLMERFSEEEEDEDEDEDVPLAVRARMRVAKAISSDEDEDANISVGESERQEQQAGASKDSQAHDAAWRPLSSSHRAIYSPFVYAPHLIKPAHPFGIYAPGTMPEELGHPAPTYSHHVTYQEDEEEDEEDLMPTETDEEALEVELKAEERLDAADSRAAAAYEAGIWRELRSASAHRDVGTSLQKSRKRRRSGDGEEVVRLLTRKRRKNVRAGGRGYDDEEADLEMFQVKSAAVIEDSDK